MKHTRLSSAPRLAPQRKLRDSPFGTLLIKQQLASNDEETVEQIRGNSYMQFFLGFAGHSSKAHSPRR